MAELRLVPGYIDWPGASQICRITRERTIQGKTSIEVGHAITSLPRRRAGAADLLSLSREHWAIENLLHGHRDVALREDACRTRRRNGPQALAALRNTCLTVIGRFGLRPVEALEQFAEHRDTALNVIRRCLPEPSRRKRTLGCAIRQLGSDQPTGNTPLGQDLLLRSTR